MRLLALGLVFLASCSSVSTSYDFDPAANFDNLKTYRWIIPAKALEASDTKQDPLVLKRVQRAADEQLGARGYQLVKSGSDFCIAARLRSRERTRVTSSPAMYGGYGYGYRYWGGQDIDVYQYEEGSLVLDIVDKTGKNLLWRGVARAAIPENPTAEQTTKLVDEAVQKLLADFPPTTK